LGNNADLGLDVDRLLTAFHISPQLLLCLLAVKQSVLLDGLADLVVAAIGGVVGHHIEDEPLLNGLLHRIEVKWLEGAIRLQLAEFLQRGTIWCGGKGEIGGVATHLARAHGLQAQVLGVDPGIQSYPESLFSLG
jgi:hypothetical protein